MAPSKRTPDDYLPLTPVVYEILVSLADEERHGYAIMQEVEERTGGRTTLRPGTLYYVSERGLSLEGDVSAGRAIGRDRLIVDY